MRAVLKKIWPLIVAAVYALLAWILMLMISHSGIYPAGADVMTHLYKADLICRSVAEGDFFPGYDPMWYNGVEALRFWSPLSSYVLALCQWLASGNPFGGYILYNGLVFWMGALVFFFVGCKKGQPAAGIFFGPLWMLLPGNLLMIYGEGNLARAFGLVLLPLLLWILEKYMIEMKKRQLLCAAGFLLLLILADHDLAVITSIGFTLYLIVYAKLNHGWIRLANIVLMMLGVFLFLGIRLLPYLCGRQIPADLAETMSEAFSSAFRSLNPILRQQVDLYLPYFGLAAFLALVFGLLCSDRKSIPAFAVGTLLFFATTRSAYQLLKIFPGNRYLHMLQYVPVAMCLLLYGLVSWKRCRWQVKVTICTLLLLDCIPSFPLICGETFHDPAERRFAAEEKALLLDTAKKLTQQRLAFLDLGDLASDGSWMVNVYDVPLKGSYGSDITCAATTYNITQLDKAYAGGNFKYLFDRTLELGNDSVLLQMKHVDWNKEAVGELDAAAALSGYHLADANERYRLYHRDVRGTFGVVSRFGAIGIGSGAGQIALDFPTVEEVTSTNINDYSYEELSQYQTVYLNGFTYTDKYEAEKMLLKLAQNGTRIVLLADGIPQDPDTKAREFLGVHAQEVVFSNGYPELVTENYGIINTDLFAAGHAHWRTVYVTGLHKVLGYTEEDGVELPFYGTVRDPNIYVLGINLTYHYALTKDRSLEDLLYEIFCMEIGEMPERRIVDLEVDYDKDRITIHSENDDVDTTLSVLQSFLLPEGAWERNRLLHVNAGDTVILFGHPYFYGGLALTLGGVLILLLTFVFGSKWDKKWKEYQEEKAGAES